MSAAELLSACGRIDAAAAAVRVLLVGIGDAAEETDDSNCATRQLALRGIVAVVEGARGVLLSTRGGDNFDNLPTMFFQELLATAEQALWVALGENGEGASSNADLCELLRLALQFHADGKAGRPALPRATSLPAGAGGNGTKGGAA